MLGLPKSTEFNKRIPKQKFYENISVSPALKRVFVEQIKTIYWRNKIAPSTMNLAGGMLVTEIEVFEVNLNSIPLDTAVLRQIDKEVPYHIVFLLEYEGKYQVWTAYKEKAASGSNAFKVGSYYHTDWLTEPELPLQVDGLSMDAVWQNFIIQIGNIQMDEGNTLGEQIATDERREKTEKEIQRLEKLARTEKQPKKKFELVQKIKCLREQA